MKTNKALIIGTALSSAFLIWTILVMNVDVQNVGPHGSAIGFSTLNMWFHKITGVHMKLYTITDWLGLIPIMICICFGALGAYQWISRRSIRRVDTDIILGIYYVCVILAYPIFEILPINYRPVLINGILEASYPSSTTLLVLSVMPTLTFQVGKRTKNLLLRSLTLLFVTAFSSFMVIGILVSGVHWLTYIIGSVLLSGGLFMIYVYSVSKFQTKEV